MTELLLDASSWKTKDDVYDSFFRVIGAPSWHGRNLDALHDSIGSGQVNSVEVSYRLIVRNSQDIGAEAKSILEDFVKLIHELVTEGCPVEIRVENTN
ncbi:MAG TPA: barstar family protein [Candidatus Dormibacteraeota bacterium]|jgi:RNAse (barnase) inhibitor barstar|nr:barstar family protein [Candidatus Dormibacteraeota bacterium]